jgi:hypothetical protein
LRSVRSTRPTASNQSRQPKKHNGDRFRAEPAPKKPKLAMLFPKALEKDPNDSAVYEANPDEEGLDEDTSHDGILETSAT